jgi:hypothetical protein
MQSSAINNGWVLDNYLLMRDTSLRCFAFTTGVCRVVKLHIARQAPIDSILILWSLGPLIVLREIFERSALLGNCPYGSFIHHIFAPADTAENVAFIT